MAKGHYDGLKITQTSDAGKLPITLEMRSSKKSVFINLGLSIALLIFALNVTAMLPDYMLGDADAPLRKWLPLGIGAFALLHGGRAFLRWFSSGAKISIDRDRVSFRSKSPIGEKEWVEPLNAYEGVRWKRFAIHEDRASDRVRTRYRHVIELVHSGGAKKSIPLFAQETGKADLGATFALARKAFSAKDATPEDRAKIETEAARLGKQAGADDPRAHWEGFASLLGLPAIDARDGAETVRAAEDVDKSVKQLAEEGKINAGWQFTPPPASLDAQTLGDPADPASQELRVLIRAGHTPRALLWIFGAVSVAWLLLGIFNLHFGALVGALLFGGAVYGIRYLERTKPRQLTVTRQELRYEDPLVNSRSFVAPLGDIETISIRDRDTEILRATGTMKLSGKKLLISTDKIEKPIAGGAPEEGLAWLRDYLIAAVANA